LIALLVCVVFAIYCTRAGGYKIEEIRLGPRDAGRVYVKGDCVVSRDVRHFACGTTKGQKRYVVVDGEAGPEYDALGAPSLVFSPDSKRVAYAARKGAKWLVVVDGEAGPEYDGLAKLSLLVRLGGVGMFSPDGKHVAYAAQKGAKWLVVVDAKEGAEFDGVSDLMFSPDGKRVAYSARKGGKSVVLVDGEESAEFDKVSDLRFSSDSKRVAYVARKGRKQLVLVDGKVSAEYGDEPIVYGLVFSPDSNRVAYYACKDFLSHVSLVVDGRPGDRYDGFGEGYPVFSPNSKRTAYAASYLVKIGKELGFRRFMVVDGKTDARYDETGGFSSADEKSFAYLGEIARMAAAGDLADIVGNTSHRPIFSPNSKRVAYLASRGEKWFLVVDGLAGEAYDGIGEGSPIFSPDSKHWAIKVKNGQKQMVVVDGHVDAQYDEVGSPTFSPDSKRAAYLATRSNKQAVVLDGKEGTEYDAVLYYGDLFNSDGILEYVALRKGSFYRIAYVPIPRWRVWLSTNGSH
jgi:Tol biopolymer transport system component